MRDNTIPIPIVPTAVNRLWRVRLTDSMAVPKTTSVLLIRGGDTVEDAVKLAMRTPGYRAFKNMFPTAEVSECCFAGEVEVVG